MKIICIGHITRDKIVTPLQTTYMAGGTTTYVARGLQSILSSKEDKTSSKVDFTLIASLANSDLEIIDEMRQSGIQVELITSVETTFFENIYGADSSDRKQNVRSIGDPFTIDKLQPMLNRLCNEDEKPYIILGSLLAGDFPIEVVEYCHKIGHVVMDAQGYFREVRFSQAKSGQHIGKVFECNWEHKENFLSSINVLKLNENEAYLITEMEDLRQAAWELHQNGVSEVLLTLGRQGSIIAAEGQIYEIPAVPELQSIDATGCGDTYVMGYIYQRSLGKSPLEAGYFASAAATIKLEGNGPLKATEAEILSRI